MNFASNEKFADEFVAQLINEFQIISTERLSREEKWKSFYDAWSMDDSDPQALRQYRGRANIKLPQIRKEVETMTRRLQRALFPEDYLKAEPGMDSSMENAVTNTLIVRHFLDNVMGLKQKTVPWLKQNVIYGTSPYRVFWKKEENEILFRKRVFKTDTLGNIIPDFKVVSELVKTYNAPYFRTEDIFNVWVYPTTATCPEEVEKIFIRTKVTWEQLLAKQKAKVAVNLDKLEGQGKKLDWEFQEIQERFQNIGDSTQLVGTDEKGEYFDLLEVYGKAELPDGKFVPYLCEIVNESIPIRITRNPYWHQCAPIGFARFIIPPGREFYGRGLPEASIYVQAQLDDTLNQTMDSTNLSLNQIVIVNPAYAPNQESFEIEPGAIWWADPAAVKPFNFPDLSDTGLKNASTLRGVITEMSDNQPQLPDPIAGKARSTGQAQLAIEEWQTDLYAFVNHLAVEALNPLAKQVHSLLQQNIDDEEIIRIAGRYSQGWVSTVVTPHELAGSYDFHWLGAIQTENKSVKTQQILNFLKIAPMIPPDAGVKLKWDAIISRLFRDGFNVQDVQNFVETPTINKSIDANLENKILEKGGYIEVQSTDDGLRHIQIHAPLLQSKDPMVRYKMQKHMEEHKKMDEMKLQQQQMAQAMQFMAENMKNQQGPKQLPGRPPNDLSQKIRNPQGNQGQLSESTDASDLERGMGGLT